MQTIESRRRVRSQYGVVALLYAFLGAAVARMLLIQAADPLAGDFAQHLTSARNPQGREYSLFTILYRIMDGLWHSDLPIVLFLVAMVLERVCGCAGYSSAATVRSKMCCCLRFWALPAIVWIRSFCPG